MLDWPFGKRKGGEAVWDWHRLASVNMSNFPKSVGVGNTGIGKAIGSLPVTYFSE